MQSRGAWPNSSRKDWDARELREEEGTIAGSRCRACADPFCKEPKRLSWPLTQRRSPGQTQRPHSILNRILRNQLLSLRNNRPGLQQRFYVGSLHDRDEQPNASAEPPHPPVQFHLVQTMQRYYTAIEQHQAGCLALFALLTAERLLYLPEAKKRCFSKIFPSDNEFVKLDHIRCY